MTMAPESEVFLKLPRTLKVGAYNWVVVLENEIDNDHCGQADFEKHTIRIWPFNITSPDHLVGIILHECLHVIFDNEKLGTLAREKEAREEQIIVGFEAGLVEADAASWFACITVHSHRRYILITRIIPSLSLTLS